MHMNNLSELDCFKNVDSKSLKFLLSKLLHFDTSHASKIL